MADMKFKMEITDEDLWCYILCLMDREKSGNNNTTMKDFLHRELARLQEIHDKWAQIESLENIGVEVTSLSV